MERKSKMERLVSDTERSILEKKEVVLQKIEQENNASGESEKSGGAGLQPTEALKRFFDRVPLSSVPGIGNAGGSRTKRVQLQRICTEKEQVEDKEEDGVVEVKMTDSMGDALKHLYKEKVLGAPVRDPQKTDTTPLTDRYVGLVDFTSMVLWALEEFEEAEGLAKVSGMVLSPTDVPSNATASVDVKDPGRTPEQLTNTAESTSQDEQFELDGFFGLLNKLEDVKSTKVGAMARSFRWGPFLPVRPEDTLLHVLLLLSKHRLKAVPVVDVESSNGRVKGFITQLTNCVGSCQFVIPMHDEVDKLYSVIEDVAVQLLLQCDGLHWFETIAEKRLSEAGFQAEHSAGAVVSVYGDDTLIVALRAMWKHRISGIPVLDRSSKCIIGNIHFSDLRIILDKPYVFNQRREMLVRDFMNEESSDKVPQSTPLQEDFAAAISAAALTLGRFTKPSMRDPITCKASDTLKATMAKLFRSRSDRCFLVDDKGRVKGVVTLRDIIMEFAPPLAETPQWGGFFESALQQTGARLGPGAVVTINQ